MCYVGNTPLHILCTHKTINSVKLFLEFGADPNLQNKDGNTPLHIAIKAKSVNATIALLGSEQTNVYCKNNRGLTCIDLSKSHREDSKVRQMLEKYEVLRQKSVAMSNNKDEDSSTSALGYSNSLKDLLSGLQEFHAEETIAPAPGASFLMNKSPTPAFSFRKNSVSHHSVRGPVNSPSQRQPPASFRSTGSMRHIPLDREVSNVEEFYDKNTPIRKGSDAGEPLQSLPRFAEPFESAETIVYEYPN